MSNETVDIEVSSKTLLLVGPVLIGGLFSWGLFGVLMLQVYMYYLAFPGDSNLVQFTVYGTFVLETFQTIVVTIQAWNLLCAGWGQEQALLSLGWEYSLVPMVSGIVSFWVQSFYARRIFVLSNGDRKWQVISILVVLVGATQGLAAFVGGIQIFFISTVEEIFHLYTTVCVWQSGSVTCDTLIAISMVYRLHDARKHAFKSDNQSTDKLLSRLIALTVETGCLTAFAAVANLVFFLALDTTNLYAMMGSIISKLYTNSLMASLNSRATIFRSSDRSMRHHSSPVGTVKSTAFNFTTGNPASRMTPVVNLASYTTSDRGTQQHIDIDEEYGVKPPSEFGDPAFGESSGEHSIPMHDLSKVSAL
ncbi:uncharacterized protein STEHIDRAFT_117999 [Stereum hirsutum FP-91666 SS1]|uniref:uncharacterized protein n=1 Tax=Stereum hirsutum (strain FP-91666) TaxID=721885 RepID=UPI000440C0B6|nr:uncharacterized protein STEHIDRAFT_117999 [Stereum hirsutum FP-91666 SS1]EIM90730.1 hypothetical protein STEHIDRAFT_117999 [Stereum hirsutum FP-91666 SS1]